MPQNNQVKWRARAVGDVERLHAFLYAKDAAVASRVVRVIRKAALSLETSPRIGRPMSDETGRRELFIAFGAGAYVLRYIIAHDGTVLIVRVWHSREDRKT